MNIFDELKERELIAQMTHEDKIREMLQKETVTFYIGFDATADSLHVGHFLQLMIMARMQMAGHRQIVLLGTGTTMVGDPTGKTDMRKMLTKEQIEYNAECFKRQMSKFIDFEDGKAFMLKNGDWLLNLNYIDFLREVGVHFSVNKMLTYECYKSRLEKGLSFIEFNYMLMQSYDFLELYRKYDCKMELGGDDQWSNIIGGVELIRRVTGDEAFGMTFNLLTTKEGKKMGKNEGGAVWLDAEKTSPYEFFQYWRNIGDDDVIKCLKMITFVSIEEINEYAKLSGAELNSAKERLAFELTKLVHGDEEANKALETSKALFANGINSENMPHTQLSDDNFVSGSIGLLDLIVLTGIAPSKAEARRLVIQNAITVDDVKITDVNFKFTKDKFNNGVIIKKGKKIFHRISM